MEKPKMTIEEFNALPDGEMFMQGTAPNSPEGLFMVRSNPGRLLRWVAKKGYGNDFAVYCGWDDEMYFGDILTNGDKVSVDALKNILDFDEEVWRRYRR